MDNFDLRKFLAEGKLHEEIPQVEGSLEITEFMDSDDEATQMAYHRLGFDVKVDDEANNETVAVMDLTGRDWLAVYAILEDCQRNGLSPFMTWNGKNYEFSEAMELADNKAAG